MYNLTRRLDKKQQTDLFIKLAKAISSLQSPEEGAEFLKDLLSEAEVMMLARRIQIAEMLMEGATYEQIRDDLKTSFNTIARIQTWLALYGEGYRKVINRSTKQKQPTSKHSNPFNRVKNKYPMYFWPHLLLEEMIKNANQRQKQRLIKVVSELKDKTRLSHELQILLKD